MKFSDNAQGTEDWFKDKLGKISASSASSLLVTSKKKGVVFGEGAETYIYQIASEIVTGMPKDDINGVYALEFGKNKEPMGRASFMMQTDLNVKEVGFCTCDEGDNSFGEYNSYLGFSADGIIESEKRGLELKCPLNTANYLRFVCTNEIKKEYLCQVQFSLMLTGWDSWYFAMYDDRVNEKPLHYIRIERDEEYIKILQERCLLAIDAINHIIRRIRG